MNSKKTIGNPLEQAIIAGTIGKKSNDVGNRTAEPDTAPIRKIGRKATKKERVQHTIYLPPVLSKWVKIEAYEQGREISDLMADALRLYKDKKDNASRF